MWHKVAGGFDIVPARCVEFLENRDSQFKCFCPSRTEINSKVILHRILAKNTTEINKRTTASI